MKPKLPKVKEGDLPDDLLAFNEIATRLREFSEEDRQTILNMLCTLFKYFPESRTR